jgi:hypothetical protein
MAFGILLMVVCTVGIRGALRHDFRDGLALHSAPRIVRRLAEAAGAIGITAQRLIFIPIGMFLIGAGIQSDPKRAYGTDGELLRLSGSPWGVVGLAAVAARLAVFVVFCCIESCYRKVVYAEPTPSSVCQQPASAAQTSGPPGGSKR